MKSISTQYGPLTPQHTSDDLRQREILPVEYYPSGAIKSIPLEKQTIIETPVGTIPSELVSFHENGVINRIFPLNGKLSGYWSQEDEFELAESITIPTPIGRITAKLLSISFHENSAIRSFTLWPGETVSTPTAKGPIATRIGVSFTPEGVISSLEPANPISVQTVAGEITAFDPDAIGVNGDYNSLGFNTNEEVIRVTTTLTKLTAIHPDGRTSIFTPEYRESWCGDTEEEVVPMMVRFLDDSVKVQTNPDLPAVTIPRKGAAFFTEPYLPQLAQPFGQLKCSV
ncbi:hypothetical protein [Pseudodesulfovibrio sediminis]|uniref:Uncharacterized protein n=1 Tax=Pseudodesulfovibrio sediminis TaxID=2810563 RepID=A0ABM7P5G2_9BACT|nr:hypothetical protein [Pseudodesulfovibrio sediminis]BCS88024.1 hypothetical protein PSDVSF_12660 [Pseudodesulfovibrio sediminis]